MPSARELPTIKELERRFPSSLPKLEMRVHVSHRFTQELNSSTPLPTADFNATVFHLNLCTRKPGAATVLQGTSSSSIGRSTDTTSLRSLHNLIPWKTLSHDRKYFSAFRSLASMVLVRECIDAVHKKAQRELIHSVKWVNIQSSERSRIARYRILSLLRLHDAQYDIHFLAACDSRGSE